MTGDTGHRAGGGPHLPVSGRAEGGQKHAVAPSSNHKRWVATLAFLVVVAALAGAAPAVASWDTTAAGKVNATWSAQHLGSNTLPTVSPTCQWTGSTNIQFTWPALSSSYSWISGFQLQRNGSADGSQVTPYSATTATDSAVNNPNTTTYTFDVQTRAGSTWSSNSANMLSNACNGTLLTAATGATSAQLASPDEAIFDSSGDMFIADSANHCVREIPAASGTNYTISMTAGYVYTIIGTCGSYGSTTTTLHDPEALAIDGSGNLYIADNGNNAVRKLAAGASTMTVFAGQLGSSGTTADGTAPTSGKLNQPGGLAIDSNGNVFISDYAASVCRVYVVIASQNKTYTAAGNGTCGSNGDGTAGQANSHELNKNDGIVKDARNDDIWIADKSNNEVRKIHCASNCTAASPTYTLTTMVGNGSSGDGDGQNVANAVLANPTGVYVDSSGNVFIADNGNNKVKMVPAASGTYYGITMSSSSAVYTIAGNGSSNYSGEGYPEKLSGINGPTDVAVYNGTVYITDQGHHMIRDISPNYNLVAAAGNGSSGTGATGVLPYSPALVNPYGVAANSSTGNVYIADTSDHRIRMWYAGTDEVATVAGTGSGGAGGDGGSALSATVKNPQDLAVDSSGDVFIADSGNCTVRELDEQAGTTTQYGQSMVQGDIYLLFGTSGTCTTSGDSGLATAARGTPYGVAVDSSGNVFISDASGCEIREIYDNVPSFAPDVYKVYGTGTCGTGAGQLDQPRGLSVLGSANVYVADQVLDEVIRLAECTPGCTMSATVMAGNGSAGDGVGGVSATGAVLLTPTDVQASGALLYIADSGNNRIAIVFGGVIINFAGGNGAGYTGDNGPAAYEASSKVGGVNSVTIDTTRGNLYFGDSSALVLREVHG
jgi:hypothetical protein